jgi:hypothetical protein
MRRRLLTVPLLLIVPLAAACQGATAPREPVVYVLQHLNEQPLPAPLDRSTSRSIDVFAGSLRLDPRTRTSGRVSGTGHVRITEADGTFRDETTDAAGNYTMTTDRLHITFDNGSTHTLAVEDGGARLRTTAATCAGFCTQVLHIYTYYRAVVAHQG